MTKENKIKKIRDFYQSDKPIIHKTAIDKFYRDINNLFLNPYGLKKQNKVKNIK